ncbi:hypothetical protein GCM10010286_40550 [Streptomyces toxytricini]|nr:hypothetical protein GCM10010286_40550 [Streptomyces toxytricini]
MRAREGLRPALRYGLRGQALAALVARTLNGTRPGGFRGRGGVQVRAREGLGPALRYGLRGQALAALGARSGDGVRGCQRLGLRV